MDKHFYKTQLKNQITEVENTFKLMPSLSIRTALSTIVSNVGKMLKSDDIETRRIHYNWVNDTVYVFDQLITELNIHEEGENEQWLYEFRHLKYCIEYFGKYYL